MQLVKFILTAIFVINLNKQKFYGVYTLTNYWSVLKTSKIDPLRPRLRPRQNH